MKCDCPPCHDPSLLLTTALALTCCNEGRQSAEEADAVLDTLDAEEAAKAAQLAASPRPDFLGGGGGGEGAHGIS